MFETHSPLAIQDTPLPILRVFSPRPWIRSKVSGLRPQLPENNQLRIHQRCEPPPSVNIVVRVEMFPVGRRRRLVQYVFLRPLSLVCQGLPFFNDMQDIFLAVCIDGAALIVYDTHSRPQDSL